MKIQIHKSVEVEVKYRVGQIVCAKPHEKTNEIIIAAVDRIDIWPNGVVKYFVGGCKCDDFVMCLLEDISNLKGYHTPIGC
jgi:hypothetical protein